MIVAKMEFKHFHKDKNTIKKGREIPGIQAITTNGPSLDVVERVCLANEFAIFS
jgi:hypothetical protein